eukprot:m.222734 g.222734  ORF g.222734 m.222734 type:complete len:220 (+) comp32851_c0_seq1:90-749(+)
MTSSAPSSALATSHADPAAAPSLSVDVAHGGVPLPRMDTHALRQADPRSTLSQPAVDRGCDELTAWLQTAAPGLEWSAPALVQAGWRGLRDLCACEPTVEQLATVLEPSGGGPAQVARLAAAFSKLRHAHALPGLTQLRQWLNESVKPGMAAFADALFVGGWRDVDDLCAYPPTHSELQQVLAAVGARRTDVDRVYDAVLRLSAGEGAGAPITMQQRSV